MYVSVWQYDWNTPGLRMDTEVDYVAEVVWNFSMDVLIFEVQLQWIQDNYSAHPFEEQKTNLSEPHFKPTDAHTIHFHWSIPLEGTALEKS